MMFDTALPYIAALLASFCSVFLKGFQHRNINGNHLRLIFFTSYAMALMDVAIIGIIVKGGWSVALPTGTGAACGMILSIKFHDRLFGKRHDERG